MGNTCDGARPLRGGGEGKDGGSAEPASFGALLERSSGHSSAGWLRCQPTLGSLGPGICLLVVDPQNDFVAPGGPMAVPGALQDARRVANMLDRRASAIEHVVVSLDTRHKMHISHPSYWIRGAGIGESSPPPMTVVSSADINQGVWKTRDPKMQSWALEYTRSLEASGDGSAGSRLPLRIWPEHCLLGTPGHAVHPLIEEAICRWARLRSRQVTWLIKGQNPHSEMHSALRAEVRVPGDTSTHFNEKLVDGLRQYNHVVCCGASKSRCVNYTLRDIVDSVAKEERAKFVLLVDGCSAAVGGEEAAQQLEIHMEASGVTLLACENV